MMKRRVVITGLGAITPGGGKDVPSYWARINSGKSAAAPITSFDASAFSTTFACEINDYNEEDHFTRKVARNKDRFVQFALVAARQAVAQANIDWETVDRYRCGVIVGSGIGGIHSIEEQHRRYLEKGPRRINPFLIPMLLINIAAGEVAIEFGCKGINKSQATACSTANHSIGDALDCIRWGKADLMIAGGAEAPITELGHGGFCAIKALSTRNDAPEKASRPFDADRDGFVMSEGSGMVVLEELGHAQKRGANILAELVGYGATCDAHHITAPAPEGDGSRRAMLLALADAELPTTAVDYINAHGTSTPYNDKFETMAIKNVFAAHADKLLVSSIKSTVGHLQGAAAAVELIACIKAIETGKVPPTINYETPDPECDLNYVPNQSVERQVAVACNNSLGFGGHNSCLVVKRFES